MNNGYIFRPVIHRILACPDIVVKDGYLIVSCHDQLFKEPFIKKESLLGGVRRRQWGTCFAGTPSSCALEKKLVSTHVMPYPNDKARSKERLLSTRACI